MQVVPAAVRASLAVNEQVIVDPDTAHVWPKVGAVVSIRMFETVEEPELPSTSVPLTVKVYVPSARAVYVFGEVQLLAGDAVGPASAH